MKLRWLIKENSVTAAMIKSYRDATDCSMDNAKQHLRRTAPPMLQYSIDGEWITVPTVVIPHND